jgi:hypothetical protein
MASDAQIDRIALSGLQSRYGIGRTAVYTRIQALQIEPLRKGNKAFVTSEQLKLLDELHGLLELGNSMSEALGKMGRQTTQEFDTEQRSTKSPLSSKLFTEQYSEHSLAKGEESSALVTSLVTLMQEVTRTQEQMLAQQCQMADIYRSTSDPLAPQRALEEAYQHGWQLSTSQLAQILGLSPKNLGRYQSFERFGFTFIKGGRQGQQATWMVTKENGGTEKEAP